MMLQSLAVIFWSDLKTLKTPHVFWLQMQWTPVPVFVLYLYLFLFDLFTYRNKLTLSYEALLTLLASGWPTCFKTGTSVPQKTNLCSSVPITITLLRFIINGRPMAIDIHTTTNFGSWRPSRSYFVFLVLAVRKLYHILAHQATFSVNIR